MFYSNNDSYMQDLYFYNQNPQAWNNYSQPMNNMNSSMQNPNMMNGNMNSMYMGPNPNNGYGMNYPQNLNNLYPSTYRIILPVALRVIANSNYQYINEDALNNMVDTVYNIVDGQIEYEEDSNNISKQEMSSNSNSNNSTSASSTNANSVSRTTDTRQTTTQTITTSRGNNRQDSLLRDIIKIIIIRELLSRNQFMPNNRQNFMQPTPQYCNSQMYN